MGWVIAVMGQKGGGGKSSTAQMLATEADCTVILVDLDFGQTTSTDWAAARAVNGFKPPVRVISDARFKAERGARRIFELREDCDLLIIDCRGGADPTSLEVAKGSDLVVLPCAPTAADLRPTVALLHELRAKGIESPHVVVALVMVTSESEQKYARAFLAAAGYEALPGYIRFKAGFRAAQNTGKSFTETLYPALNREASDLLAAIHKTLEVIQEKYANQS
jgi:chromosome partitioning protein